MYTLTDPHAYEINNSQDQREADFQENPFLSSAPSVTLRSVVLVYSASGSL